MGEEHSYTQQLIKRQVEKKYSYKNQNQKSAGIHKNKKNTKKCSKKRCAINARFTQIKLLIVDHSAVLFREKICFRENNTKNYSGKTPQKNKTLRKSVERKKLEKVEELTQTKETTGAMGQ